MEPLTLIVGLAALYLAYQASKKTATPGAAGTPGKNSPVPRAKSPPQAPPIGAPGSNKAARSGTPVLPGAPPSPGKISTPIDTSGPPKPNVIFIGGSSSQSGLSTIGQAGAAFVAPRANVAAGQAGEQAGTFLSGLGGGKYGSPVGQGFDKAGNIVSQAGSALGGAGPLGGVFLANSLNIRGKTEKQQAAIFGNAALKTTQTWVSAVPVFGAGISAGLGAAAGTYEGKRAVKAVGTGIEQGYTFQRELTSGHVSTAFSELGGLAGGSSHEERMAKFKAAESAARKQAGSVSTQGGGEVYVGVSNSKAAPALTQAGAVVMYGSNAGQAGTDLAQYKPTTPVYAKVSMAETLAPDAIAARVAELRAAGIDVQT